MKKILITGGAGYVGAVLVPHLLDKGFHVTVLDLMIYGEEVLKKNNNLKIVKGDIRDKDLLKKIIPGHDDVLHLACISNDPSFELNPTLGKSINLDAFEPMVKISIENKVERFIYASSSSVYGINSKVPFSEADPIFSAISPYAASKLACEALGHVYHNVYGMDVCMLRFFTVYGPRQRPDLAIHKFARLMHAGQPIPLYGDGNTSRDYTYVDDTVDGVIAATEKEFGSPIVVTIGPVVSLSESIRWFEKNLAK